MLKQILHEIENTRGAIQMGELSRKLDVDRSALDGMIQFWVRKGMLRDDDADLAAATSNCTPASGDSCGTSCAGAAACPFIAKMPQTYSIPAQKSD